MNQHKRAIKILQHELKVLQYELKMLKRYLLFAKDDENISKQKKYSKEAEELKRAINFLKGCERHTLYVDEMTEVDPAQLRSIYIDILKKRAKYIIYPSDYTGVQYMTLVKLYGLNPQQCRDGSRPENLRGLKISDFVGLGIRGSGDYIQHLGNLLYEREREK